MIGDAEVKKNNTSIKPCNQTRWPDPHSYFLHTPVYTICIKNSNTPCRQLTWEWVAWWINQKKKAKTPCLHVKCTSQSFFQKGKQFCPGLIKGIWQDVVVQIGIICLLPHPSILRAFFRIKLEICYIQARKQLLTILRSRNSKEIDHFEEVIHPKQRVTETPLFVCKQF